MTNIAAPQPEPQATPERILQRLDWTVIRRLDGLLQGDYRTLFYGAGVDFADLREYQPPDDVRHIDWNVTARMDTPYVRQYVEDRDITAWFLLDLSPSMTFGPLERPKRLVLTDFVTTLARLLTRNGNRIGAIIYRSQVEQTIAPRGGRKQVLRLTHALLEQAERPARTPTQLGALLQAGANTFRRRSLVFVISDFLSEPGWEKPLSLLDRRHELVGIRLYDPHEEEIPDVGLIVVEDAETGEQIFVDTSNAAFRRRFYAAAAQRRLALGESLRRAGVDLFAISTAEAVDRAILQIAALRKRRRR